MDVAPRACRLRPFHFGAGSRISYMILNIIAVQMSQVAAMQICSWRTSTERASKLFTPMRSKDARNQYALTGFQSIKLSHSSISELLSLQTYLGPPTSTPHALKLESSLAFYITTSIRQVVIVLPTCIKPPSY